MNEQSALSQITVGQLVSEARAAAELYKILIYEDEATRHFINSIIQAVYGIDCLRLLLPRGIEDPPVGYGRNRSQDNKDSPDHTFPGPKQETNISPEQEKTPPWEQEVYLTPTELGKRLGISPQKTNKLLEKHGLIRAYRNRQNHVRWRPTEKGRPYVIPEHIKKKPDGSRRQCLMFSETVIKIIGG